MRERIARRFLIIYKILNGKVIGMARFTLPRDIYFGKDAMEELKVLEGHKKAFVVTGGTSMQKFGFLQKLKDKMCIRDR